MQLHVTSLPGRHLGAAGEWLDWLAEAGQTWWQVLPLGPPDRYGSPYKSRSAFAAWRGLLADPRAPVEPEEIDAFCAREAWAQEWAAFAGGRRALADQVRFDREWAAVRARAAQLGIRLLGDVPIYVAPDGADHRAHPELFRDDEVAGAPPDAYSATGQLWGNPMYDWPAHRRRGYAWWIARLQRTLSLFDAARIDHFRGFVAGWAVPAGAHDASTGRWRRAPGAALFGAAQEALGGPLALIAEDLGVITEPVTRLRRELGLPGMAVLQFAFDPDDPDGPHRIENHGRDRVAYTGTHDSDTLLGWYSSLDDVQRAAVDRVVGEEEVVSGLTRWWMGSQAPLVMLQAQDLLRLGSQARMNTPGRATGNWRWELPRGALGAREAQELRAMTREARRCS